MQVIKFPQKAELKALLKRPAIDVTFIEKQVSEVLQAVKQNGDKALRAYTKQFDKADLKDMLVTAAEIKGASAKVSPQLKKAIKVAQANILKFHQAQIGKTQKIETTKGVLCWRESKAIQQVGLYIPGGSAPLFSTVLMLAIPAKIAGCKRIVLCTPPAADASIHPAILYAANMCGVNEIYKVGGAQAIAALAYGTERIAVVDKIFGPGNQYVTMAKQLVQKDGVAIDMPAGPSEVMVVADASADPAFVAADLLSQAEHGPDSQVILIAFQQKMVKEVIQQLEVQLELLPRKEIAAVALKNSKIILVKNEEAAAVIINTYAPEHLILAVKKEEYFLKHVVNAGSVFLGNYTPESAGDYASGTNHTLPTNGYARSYSGVSVDSFVKKITYQRINAKGLKSLGPVIEVMAAAEGLDAHKNAVSIRLKKLNA